MMKNYSLIILVTKNGESSHAIFKQLRSSGALVELIKVMHYYLLDLTDLADATDISYMVQALALLSSRNLLTKVEDRKGQRDVALQLFKQFSTSYPPGISFFSAGIIGHSASVLSNLLSPLLKNSTAEYTKHLAGVFEDGDMNEQLLNDLKQFFSQLDRHRNCEAAAQLCRLLRLLLPLWKVNTSTSTHLQPDMADSSIREILTNIQNFDGSDIFSVEMKEDIKLLRDSLGLPEMKGTTSSSNMVAMTQAENSKSWNFLLIFSVLTNILCFLFLGFYLASLSACDRDMGSMLFPLQPSWAANSSAVSWSCVGEVAAGCSSLQSKLQTVNKDRDILLQEVNSLTSTMNMLRKEYQASNFTFEKQIQTLEKEKISLETIQINLREKVKQLEEQHDSNAKLLSEQRDEIEQSQSHVKSLEKEKKSLEAIQITLREKVEEVEDQRDSNAKLLRAQSDEIKQLQERVKPLSSSQETKVAPSESLGRNSNIQYFQSLSQNFAYWVGSMVFLFLVGCSIYACVMDPTNRLKILIFFEMILCWWLLLVAFRSNGGIHFARLGDSLFILLVGEGL